MILTKNTYHSHFEAGLCFDRGKADIVRRIAFWEQLFDILSGAFSERQRDFSAEQHSQSAFVTERLRSDPPRLDLAGKSLASVASSQVCSRVTF